jgi:uncharacterized membrane protein YoaT (DUF817 family)
LASGTGGVVAKAKARTPVARSTRSLARRLCTRLCHRLPGGLLVGLILVATFIGFAENLGTFVRAWTYPSQNGGWHPVSIEKLGSWCLLMIISFVLVAAVHRERRPAQGTDA